jgi:choline monooxygenase
MSKTLMNNLIATEQGLLSHTLPAQCYTSSLYHEIDVDLFIKGHWQLVAHESQLLAVGDQIVESICGIPIVIVRSDETTVKAFYNVCKHRAGPVAKTNTNSKVLRCQYHGWTYDLNGQLKVAPEMKSTPSFELANYQLAPILVECWNGFIFIALNEPSHTVDNLLAGVADLIKPISFEDMQFSHRQEYIIDCNWKVYMDNYLEGYHLPVVHPELNKLLDYRLYQTELFEHYSYQSSPMSSSTDSTSFYGEGKAHYFCLFPNMMLNILPNRIQTNQIYPIDRNHCRVVFDTYYSDCHKTEVKKMIEADKQFSDDVQLEDIGICQDVQKGLESGGYQRGIFCSARETGVQHYQYKVDAAYKLQGHLIDVLAK